MATKRRFDTLAVHTGAIPDAATGALAPPLHLATTFLHAPDGTQDHGYIYQRDNNPTQVALEDALAALDGASRALFFSTGMAAATAMLQAPPAGSEVLFQNDLYHGVRELALDWLPRWGCKARFVDASDLDALRAAIGPATACIWIETPSNPLLRIADIAACAELAHGVGAKLVVDGTFATPALQQPLALGADVVLHSATKYMGGHSDVMGGVLAFRHDDELAAHAFEIRKLHGGSGSPFAAWMVHRGLRSLGARMRVHCENAARLAEFLTAHAAVSMVHYPGLSTHPQNAVASRQMHHPGGMLSFELAAGRDAALQVAGATRIIHCATSLGGCESLIEHRASVEGSRPVSPPGLLRLSVGLEHVDDLIEDLDQALAGIHG